MRALVIAGTIGHIRDTLRLYCGYIAFILGFYRGFGNNSNTNSYNCKMEKIATIYIGFHRGYIGVIQG